MLKTVALSQWMLLFEMLFLARVTFVILTNMQRDSFIMSQSTGKYELKCVLCACFIPGTSYLVATDNIVAKMDSDSLITSYSAWTSDGLSVLIKFY